MKILNLLEGTIIVPKSTLNDGMNLICQDLFSKIFTYLQELGETDEDGEYADLESSYKTLHAQYSKIYSRIPLSLKALSGETHGTLFMRGEEIESRYLKRNQRAASAIVKIAMTVKPTRPGDIEGGSFEANFKRKTYKLMVSVPSAEELESIAKNPEKLHPVMIELHGTLKHELMHGIQRIAFNNEDGVDYYDDTGIQDDKYYSSELEFSPLIVTAVAQFKSMILKHSLESNTKELAASYVNPTAPIPDRFDKPLTNPLFDRLYKTDKPKWKKAVKYFYGLIAD